MRGVHDRRRSPQAAASAFASSASSLCAVTKSTLPEPSTGTGPIFTSEGTIMSIAPLSLAKRRKAARVASGRR